MDELFDWFKKVVIGCWVRFRYQNKDRIALIIEAKDHDDKVQLPLYTLGKNKTTI